MIKVIYAGYIKRTENNRHVDLFDIVYTQLHTYIAILAIDWLIDWFYIIFIGAFSM